jgi:hypothetical protein
MTPDGSNTLEHFEKNPKKLDVSWSVSVLLASKFSQSFFARSMDDALAVFTYMYFMVLFRAILSPNICNEGNPQRVTHFARCVLFYLPWNGYFTCSYHERTTTAKNMGILKYHQTSLISYERGWPLAYPDGLIKPNQASHQGAR